MAFLRSQLLKIRNGALRAVCTNWIATWRSQTKILSTLTFAGGMLIASGEPVSKRELTQLAVMRAPRLNHQALEVWQSRVLDEMSLKKA